MTFRTIRRWLKARLRGRRARGWRLNVRLAAALVVAGLVVGVGVHALHVFQVRRQARVMLRRETAADLLALDEG